MAGKAENCNGTVESKKTTFWKELRKERGVESGEGERTRRKKWRDNVEGDIR